MTITRQGPGRPRDREIDDAVLRAARELLAETGYDGVTMDETAVRAGTSKAAIYRRYRSKAELLFAAAVHPPGPSAPADTGTLHGDLLALAGRIRDDLASPGAREVAAHLIAEIGRAPDVADRLRERFVAFEREQIRDVLARAASRGELEPELDPDADRIAAHALLGGALFFTTMVIGDDLDDGVLAGVVAVLIRGLAAPTTPPG
ncbi:TetR/AcrR family transcriptional regulator [Agromyces agglutinans]|uniref:TetR/AcrR family transcriptional regulator n=1 Tax=Agromyces agglutinans TaxID=2662258 RepID=UPI0015627ADB|nr:TetR/AcrR family transcriptional regulator [Agromyces agglutinans]